MSMSELYNVIEKSRKVGVVLKKRWPKDPGDCWRNRIGIHSFDQPTRGAMGFKIVRVEIVYDITTVPVCFL